MYNSGNSSKNVRGSAIVDGTVEAADLATAVNNDIADGVAGKATADLALPLAGGAMTGAITTNSTFDGVDIATRDGILTTTTATANDALPKTGGALTGAVTTNSTFDGRDVATDGAALDVLDLAINSAADAAAITIDASENVGIGTTTPVAPLTVRTADGGFTQLEPTGSVANATTTGLRLSGKAGEALRYVAIECYNGGANNVNNMVFKTSNNDVVTERMRIDYLGNVLVGTTTTYGKLTSTSTINGSWGSVSIGTNYAKSSRVTSGAGYVDFFYTGTGSTYAGYIYANGGTTTYATTSDYRLKENVVPMTGSIDRLKDLKPSKFNFIGEDKTVDGFLAHEAQAVVPECVHGTKDAMHPEVLYTSDDELPEGVNIGDVKEASAPDYQGIDQSKLVPLLVASLQEAIARIEILENA
jgi:hypothetical protein